MSRSMEGSTIIILFCSIFLIVTSTADVTITANQTIRDDGNSSSIESAGGVFQLGFFSPGSSKNRYLGIWYKKIPNNTVVWVANRETPLTDKSGVLRIQEQGNLVLTDGKGNIIWSTNNSSSSSVLMNLVAQLNDDGNFVLNNGSKNLLWQSFDHPGDNLLPGMKLGWDLVKNLDRHLTSWKSADDPSPGDFTAKIILSGYPQLLLMKKYSSTLFRYGPWNGIQFNGQFGLGRDIRGSFIENDLQIYYKYDVPNSSIAARMVLNPNGTIQFLRWIDQIQSWEMDPTLTAQRDDCDRYALCGPYSSCYLTISQLGYGTCRCLNGYQPKVSANWNLADWSDGCVRQAPLKCGNGDRFVQYTGLKYPDTWQSWFNQSTNLVDCERLCLKNCSCTAYTNIDTRRGGMGCLLWFGDLIDIREYGGNIGEDIYIRMAASDLVCLFFGCTEVINRSSRGKKRANIRIIIIPVTIVPTILLLGLLLMHVSRKKRLKRQLRSNALHPENDGRTGNEREDLELPLIGFETIADATDNFSKNNKLGEGGFGPVYKGILDNGQEIAVKRLSKSSKQGIDEFKNEVSCIAKLQHRNLVRLLGCCIEEGEMLLIYEYMSNNSLDSFIFDKELCKLLDWPKRYDIINGIVKGLLYLHQDSRLRIIHRDLKASNILLDYEMNPRISDFGLARTFGGNESAVNTTRVVGTYGYMPPEYIIDGLFSVKSDVFSFGVVVLEIVSGKKIRDFYQSDRNLNLLGHAWKLYTEGNFLELTDDAIANCNHFEVSRAIQIGLLCVQPYPKDRPSMSTVVSMLSNENELPRPKEPGFFTERQHGPDSSSSKHGSSSRNELTFTLFAPRW